ncbi:hypothetical protein OIO90_004523 [Microbotryomycetes sp. JL221]|nr:hypothetical protein OIO90_004523 [Microbotryomycetes sp. JL221]
MSADTRGSFRPTRASSRASLGAMPSATVTVDENASATDNGSTSAKRLDQRKKRALSLGGEALERVVQAKSLLQLSPGHQARRKMAPRRSILKSSSSNSLTGDLTGQFDWAHTTDLSSLSSFNMAAPNNNPAQARANVNLAMEGQNGDNDDDHDDDEDEDEDGTMDMDITRMSNTSAFGAFDRRKSALSRRVSFAPSAHIRMFTPNKPTAEAQALLYAQQQAIAAAAQAGIDTANAAADASVSWSSDDDEDDEGSFAESEPSMELAADEVTHAFRGHFAGTKLPVSVLTGQDEEEQDQNFEGDDSVQSTNEDSEDGTADMDEANTAEITSAFAQQKTSVFNSQSAPQQQPQASARSPGKKPRFSEVVRQEDEEDDEIMRHLGLRKPGSSAADVKTHETEQDEDEGDDAERHDDTAAMDMTTAVGVVLQASSTVSDAATVPSSNAVDADMETDQTADVQDATGVGGILTTSVARAPANDKATNSAPATPNSRRQSLASRSPRRLSLRSPRSPRRLTNPPSAEAFATGRSPARSVSPMPAAPIVSPVRRAMSLEPGAVSSSSQLEPSSSLVVPTKTPPRVISPLRSTTTLTPGRTPRSGFTPRVLVPPQSAGRSPGGSLSLRGLLQEQMASRTSTTTTSSSSGPSIKSPARASPRKTLLGVPSPKRAADSMLESPRVKLARVTEEVMDDNKNDVDTSFAEIVAAEEDEVFTPLPILSLDEFFEATGTGFMKDVLGMTGVDLGNKRRKSMAPNTGRKPSGPPSFADLAVAGGCKSLFHQLYQSDHFRLQEEITNIMSQLAQCEEALKHEQPQIFTEWSSANESRRLAMQNQFRMIKAYYYLVGRIEWNECRAQNHQSIIEVMEENLEGLRADNAVVDESNFDDVLPSLEARREALLAELHAERQRDVELSACDQEELEAMHAAVAEQAEELEKLERGYDEVASQLAGLTSKADDLAAQVTQSTAERDGLAQTLEEGRCFTKAEVFRLQGEYDALQHLHGWKLVKFNSNNVRLQCLDDFDVTLTLGPGRVKIVEFEFNKIKPRTSLDLAVTQFMFDKVSAIVQSVLEDARTPNDLRARSILRRIDSLWTNARRIRHEVLLTNHRFPTRTNLNVQSSTLEVVADVHVSSAKSSFEVTFELTGEELVAAEDVCRPAGLDLVVTKVGSDVGLKFGKVDLESLKYIVRERLDVGGRGAFVEACNEAEAKYESS